jgi:hypothetical protein
MPSPVVTDERSGSPLFRLPAMGRTVLLGDVSMAAAYPGFVSRDHSRSGRAHASTSHRAAL